MNIHVVTTGLSKTKDLEALKTKAEFRKATRNMMLAWSSIEDALSTLGGILPASTEGASTGAIVMGSGFGELEVTRNFLSGLADSGVARPLLFQNSLHNATLGFIAMKMAFTGPSITLSNRCFTGENCIEVAMQLLTQGQCQFCLVTGVDTLVPELTEVLNAIYSSPVALGEGAATLLLTNDDGLKILARPALAQLHDVTYGRRAEKPAPCDFDGYYEADAIERLVLALRAAGTGTLTLEKPDGTHSSVHWSQGNA